jgi:anti-sigma regulatory factor (Ser/Thr protein kinase)
MCDDCSADGRRSHLAVFYRDRAEYLTSVLGFIQAGVSGAERVLVAVPSARARLLRDAMDSREAGVTFRDMAWLGRNPARIIPALWDFIGRHPGRVIRHVSEPIWPARSDAEIREAIRHEALVNLAFTAAEAAILCPYDAGRLPPGVLADAERTHPVILEGGRHRASARYLGPDGTPPDCQRPIPPPPRSAAAVAYDRDLRPVRDLVGRHAAAAGLPPPRASDLVLAASEIAANTVRHTSAGGTVQAWQTRDEVVCQVQDQGWIADPLAGRRRPAPDAAGQGLWVVNQVCDLVEVRTGPAGTATRLHMRIRR